MHIVPVLFATPAFDQLVKLRIESLYKPFNATLEVEDLEAEYKDLHFAIYNNSAQMLGGIVVVTHEEEDEFHNRRKILLIRQVVIRPEHQGKGFGKAMVQHIEQAFLTKGFKEIRLYSHLDAVDFYIKLGYKKHGRQFNEKGVKHLTMKKKLNATVLENSEVVND